ncbi:NlpC/P60 family protein [Janibacter cremeus]|uniref:C40 family peptidase n=1 Tax=Janibacter cremeus TaxID=1285192 RepID=UPI0023F8951B|nr:NlpC/P60 family protein [Janibacter cremeus]WEV77225.1 NlpC/P60 family protein [Janibacter cremeus]
MTTTFYAGRHRAVRTAPSTTQRAGVGVLAAAALSLGATTMTATSASANAGGPTGSAPAPTSSTVSSDSSGFDDYVRVGDTGAVVEEIQQEVGATQDGVFGAGTEQAVEAWQGDNGLVADGVVGPRTGSAMGLDGATGSTSGDADATATSGGTTSVEGDAEASSLLGTAESLVGTPYVYGGEDPSGFDCSGFTQYVFAQHGIDLPRMTGDQQAAATPVSNPQPGDLVFFGSPAYHVGIYAGDGKMYDSGTEGSTVTKRDIWTDDVTYGRF